MIIDTHTHFLDGNWLSAGVTEVTVEEIISAQDTFGISEMWISSIGALAEDFCFYNRKMYEKTKAYKTRFKYFAAASPYYGSKAVDEIRRCIEDYDFRGIKIHFWMQGGSVHSPTTHRFMELSIKYKVPVLFHDGTPPACDSLQIAYLADLYPEARIILGHSGMHDTARSALEASIYHKNVYLCLSCSTLQDAGMIFQKAPADQLLFGSDYGAGPGQDLISNRRDTIEFACKDELLKHKIYYENAARLMEESSGGK
jgi:predicted TIM-barrel fold metal-dependent hydrolase